MSIKVEPRKNEGPDKLIQRFKKIISKEGVLRELRRRAYFEKPSAKRRRKEKEREKNRRKHEQKRERGYIPKRERRDRDY